ncbi:MAG: Rpn family recombination-promoting nuclease/putative transposase [Lamprobacter sp.]|uniref:Rpn family recombination-promoting nuclease/putative transposase n=1 Tax=Lamprobacter sp. TaxID=3100796 RepID=UPI002B25BCA0|nr:Rpn family recombination-promoting nuclease/putative transposase [Lamprobacter sp.]MEA3638825.1 Rpn family recombination-promoting nuclease/putative transposase [Lamprobacter sp.]
MADNAPELLDPKNDYVFFRVFSEEPELLVDLINAVRFQEPPIIEVSLLDPRLTAERLSGKRLVLDLKAIDEQGQRYNVEMQVRRFPAWSARGTLYLARMLSEQSGVGEDYGQLKPVIGIHLLDFALFAAPEQADQALWCFELRDRDRPAVRLGRELQLNVVELRKADALGHLPARLSAWIAYFEHWREEAVMNTLTHPPVQKARGKLHTMSADEQARYWAEAREKALRDEATLLAEAREQGLEKGSQAARRATALAMLSDGQLDDATIARYSGLSLEVVQRLRQDTPH